MGALEDIDLGKLRAMWEERDGFHIMKPPVTRLSFESKIWREPDPRIAACFTDKDFSDIPRFAKSHFKNQGLPELLEQIQSLSDPLLFKEAMLRTVQLYFDGMIEKSHPVSGQANPESIWEEQSSTLYALLGGVRMAVAGFYRNGEIPFSNVRDVVLPHASTILKYGAERPAKDRHLDGSTAKKMTDFAEDVVDGLSGRNIDLVVPVASGGFEPGVLVADYLEVDQFSPVRYYSTTAGGAVRDDRGPWFAPYASTDQVKQQIYGKNVLVVDDIATTTLSAARSLDLIMSHGPKEVYFAVVDGCKAPGLESYTSLSRHLRIVE